MACQRRLKGVKLTEMEPSDFSDLFGEFRRLSKKVNYLLAMICVMAGVEVWDIAEHHSSGPKKDEIVSVEKGTHVAPKKENEPHVEEAAKEQPPIIEDNGALVTPAPTPGR
jgi:hypothetical protein